MFPKKKTLLIGSSIIRNIDPQKLVSTDVKCIRGGKVKDVLTAIQSSDNVDQMVIVVGSNDCAEENRAAGDVQDILHMYEDVITAAVEK